MMAQTSDDVDTTVEWGRGGGKFSRIPSWVYEAEISDRAVRLYVVLAGYADREGASFPGKTTICGQLKCSLTSLNRAITELERIGALAVTPRYRQDGSRTSNSYTLNWIRDDQTPLHQRGVPPLHPREGQEELKPVRTKTSSGAKAPSLPEVPQEAPIIIDVDGQNIPLNTLMEECGVDKRNTQRLRWAVSALNGVRGDQGIRHLFWLEAVRWCEENNAMHRLIDLHDPFTFQESLTTAIKRKAAVYRRTMDGARLTPTALRNWWLDLELQRQRDDVITTDEMRSWST